MKATRIYNGPDGLSRFEEIDVPLADGGSIGHLSEKHPVDGVIFRETGDTYDYDWHPAPRKQWLVMLDGQIVIETGDGATREFSAGSILLLEDTEGRGHRTRQLSKGVRRSLFLPIPPTSRQLT